MSSSTDRAARLPFRPARRAAVVSEHARRLLDEPGLDEETRVHLHGALRACEAMGGGATTMPNVSHRQILNASATEVAAIWTRVHGTPPWPEQPLILRLLRR